MHKGEDEVYAAFVSIDWADKKHDVCVHFGVVSRQGGRHLHCLPGAVANAAARATCPARDAGGFLPSGQRPQRGCIEKCVKAIREERPLHTDEAVIGPARLLVEALLPQLRVLSEGISRFEAQIAELAPQQPDYQFFDDLPGAGPTFAPRLLVAFGEHRDRFPTASSLQKSAGIAPVMERSGNKAWVHWRYGCSKFVRQTFVEWAAQTIPRFELQGHEMQSHIVKGADLDVAAAQRTSALPLRLSRRVPRLTASRELAISP
jgi:hypothetical protein